MSNQEWLSSHLFIIEKTDAEAEAPILWPPDVKSWLTGKDPDDGRDWGGKEKDEMVGWHYQLDGHEFEQTLGESEEWGSLVCCSPRGHKESDMIEGLNNKTYQLSVFLSLWIFCLYSLPTSSYWTVDNFSLFIRITHIFRKFSLCHICHKTFCKSWLLLTLPLIIFSFKNISFHISSFINLFQSLWISYCLKKPSSLY